MSYVNAYGDFSGGTPVFNNGDVIPTFLRIGGGILDEDSFDADKIIIFFDDAVTMSNFYEDSTSSNEVSCSEEECNFY